MLTKQEMEELQLRIDDQLNMIKDLARAESRELSPAENERIAELVEDFDALESAKRHLSQGRQAAAQLPNAQNRGTGRSSGGRFRPSGTEADFGFHDLADFALSVKAACGQGGVAGLDPRLIKNAPSTYSTEGVGEDGGFAAPPAFITQIWQKVAGENSLLALTDQNQTQSNSIFFCADEEAPWSASSPLQAHWEGEARKLDESRIALRGKMIRLNKLTALVPASDELLEDAPSLDVYLRKKVTGIFDYKVSRAIVAGTGVGQPLGILNAASLLSVAKEEGQQTDTLLYENFTGMIAKMDPALFPRSIWLANANCIPQLLSLYQSVGLTGQPLEVMSQKDGKFTILTRPVYFSETCETVGDKGDIILVTLDQYMTAVKTGGIKTEVSIHLWFDYAIQAYRFILRIAGMPWWATSFLGRDGVTKYSFAVTLDERT
jgi:HK97 family phage major capsid protein